MEKAIGKHCYIPLLSIPLYQPRAWLNDRTVKKVVRIIKRTIFSLGASLPVKNSITVNDCAVFNFGGSRWCNYCNKNKNIFHMPGRWLCSWNYCNRVSLYTRAPLCTREYLYIYFLAHFFFSPLLFASRYKAKQNHDKYRYGIFIALGIYRVVLSENKGIKKKKNEIAAISLLYFLMGYLQRKKS